MSEDLRQLLTKAISQTINAMSDAQLKTMVLDGMLELAAEQKLAEQQARWADVSKMMVEWLAANTPPAAPAQPAPVPPIKSTPIDIAKYFIEHAIGCVQGLQVVQYVGDPHGHWKNCAVSALHWALEELKKAAAEKGGAT